MKSLNGLLSKLFNLPKPDKPKKPNLKTVETVLLMEHISSLEHMAYLENITSSKNFIPREHTHTKGQNPYRILKDINLEVKRRESWAIYGETPLEVSILLEIIANIRPYHDGKCVLAERGMMKNKGLILEHVFYLGDVNMIYNNMNVLEFLMFATAKQKGEPVFRQEKIFKFLMTLGLGYISLTPIKTLTKEEKAIVILLGAAYSKSLLIIFNFPGYGFNEILIGAIKGILKLITDKGNSVILGTGDSHLIDKACSHTAYLANGKIIYRGGVEDLKTKYDNILLTIRDKNPSNIMEKLAPLLPDYKLVIEDKDLLIKTNKREEQDLHFIYEKIIELGFVPQKVITNPKTVKNAYEEIKRQYDL